MNIDLFSLSEDYENVIFWDKKVPVGIAYVVLPEAYRQMFTPPEVEGHELLENHFARQRPNLVGFAFTADN